jgi:hypothetical protein
LRHALGLADVANDFPQLSVEFHFLVCDGAIHDSPHGYKKDHFQEKWSGAVKVISQTPIGFVRQRKRIQDCFIPTASRPWVRILLGQAIRGLLAPILLTTSMDELIHRGYYNICRGKIYSKLRINMPRSDRLQFLIPCAGFTLICFYDTITAIQGRKKWIL